MELLGLFLVFAVIGLVGAIAYWGLQLAFLGVLTFLVVSILVVLWNLFL